MHENDEGADGGRREREMDDTLHGEKIYERSSNTHVINTSELHNYRPIAKSTLKMELAISFEVACAMLQPEFQATFSSDHCFGLPHKASSRDPLKADLKRIGSSQSSPSHEVADLKKIEEVKSEKRNLPGIVS